MKLAQFAAPLLFFAVAPVAAAQHAATAADGAPYVPTPHDIVARMLELAEAGPDDYLVDLGSGDGRIVLTAARTSGARGLGVEIREDLVERARRAAIEQGVADRVRFVRQDLFDTDLSEATVVTIYLLPETVNRLRDKLLWELHPGTRIVSHDYPIEGWKSERVVRLEHAAKVDVTGIARTRLYLYRVPADVHGRWTVTVSDALSGERLDLEFAQRLTKVRGRAWRGERAVPLQDVTLSGLELSFELPDRNARFTGRVGNGTMEGTVAANGVRGRWRATRG